MQASVEIDAEEKDDEVPAGIEMHLSGVVVVLR